MVKFKQLKKNAAQKEIRFEPADKNYSNFLNKKYHVPTPHI
jgi:hypothetical protein